MINFSNFGILDPEVADTARNLFDGELHHLSPFGAFMHTWLAFNVWMEAITEAATDAQMIAALANAYTELLRDPGFRESLDAFAEEWPVLNVRDTRVKLGRDVFWRMNRGELIEAAKQQGVKMQPTEWEPGDLPTWPQFLRTIYLIRCNLFHGAKSPRIHVIETWCCRQTGYYAPLSRKAVASTGGTRCGRSVGRYDPCRGPQHRRSSSLHRRLAAILAA